MRHLLPAVALLLLLGAPALGQTDVTAQRIGDFTFYSGTVDGKRLSGSSQSIGSFEYSSVRVGDESIDATSQRIGSFTYTDYSNGRTSTTQRLGSPDPYGADTWDEMNAGRVFVHIANSEAWTAITGESLPPTPVTVELYNAYGLPWFELWDHEKGDLAPSGTLAGIQSIDEIDAQTEHASQTVVDGVW